MPRLQAEQAEKARVLLDPVWFVSHEMVISAIPMAVVTEGKGCLFTNGTVKIETGKEKCQLTVHPMLGQMSIDTSLRRLPTHCWWRRRMR